MESIQCHGLWVPKSDAGVFARYDEFEGLPDLDVSKVAKCVALAEKLEAAIDVGAHVGAVSVYLARKFERVFALEAVPSTFECLRLNTDSIPNISAMNIAAASTPGDLYLSHYPRHGQLSHVTEGADVPKTVRIGPIPARPIDSLEISNVSFLKIDVEGYELPVLEGARRTIEEFRPLILVEQGGNEELHFGRPRDEASRFLEGLGMRLHPGAPVMSKDRLFTF
jgi:FkbM family methyltransferase